nr:hypothetical protein [Pedobacter panaciterrae]
MKCYYLLIAITFSFSRAQTNTFPSSGKVGIGTLTPIAALDVYGLIQISGLNMTTPPPDLNYGLFPFGGVGLGIFSGATDPYQGIGIWTNPNGTKKEVMRILSGGNVGIGTINPNAKLAVNGNIRAHEIKVETANWPDYVFAKDYHLPSLKETEEYIREKGHLQGIPSAEEVKANGIDLGEINAKLLQKIEELTLYLIEMKKENEQERFKQEKMIEKQEKDIQLLKSKTK